METNYAACSKDGHVRPEFHGKHLEQQEQERREIGQSCLELALRKAPISCNVMLLQNHSFHTQHQSSLTCSLKKQIGKVELLAEQLRTCSCNLSLTRRSDLACALKS